ncbi:MAG: 30S ribosomal protein S1 [Deltaproteobacteria bacterium RBG_13_43_22]|nr:MAG: 30S ribosomal protein S1 [Deltaproteobacteria bacterium RBG_13_43_22]
MEKNTEETGNQEHETQTKEKTALNEKTLGTPGEEEFRELYEESLKTFQEGEVVKGRIVGTDKEFVMIDIGYKSEGRIPISEFLTPSGEITAQTGDWVDVLIEKRDDEEGDILLSKERAAKILVWDEISRIYRDDGIIEGKIVGKVKGGLTVDIGIPAFLPGSQIDLQPIRDMDHLLEATFPFKILKYNKKRNNVVLSRRVLLEKERDEQRSTILSTLENGQVLEGVVKNITDYGIFIDLGGIDGLLHVTDMSWGRASHPADLCKVGDKMQVKVLNFDRERHRVSLGLKQLHPDPWTTVRERYPIGQKVNGKIVNLTDYGAFVELENGVEGLIHVSEMSWTQKVKHPSKLVSVGEVVEAVVLSVDPDKKRISLGMKQVEPNPWDVIAEKYPVGTVIEGKIKNITDFGLFIGIDEGIDGLVHISDISWIKRVRHPSELYKKGQEVQAKVLHIDKDQERFSLGVKQLEPDPWEEIPKKYPTGSIVNGIITNVTDFGIFIEVEEGVEGLVHVSEASKEKIKTPVGLFKVGDPISAKVINVAKKERRIGLSIRRAKKEEDQILIKEYLNSSKEASSNLGDLLREEMENKNKFSLDSDES